MFKSIAFLTLVVGWVLSLSGCSVMTERQAVSLAGDDSVDIEVIWRRQVGEGNQGSYSPLATVLLDETLFAADPSGIVKAYDLTSGRLVWQRQLETEISGGLNGEGQQVFVATRDGRLHALSADNGDVVWSKQLSSESIAAVGLDERRLFVHTVDGRITALERVDGEQAWSYASAMPILTVRGSSQPVVLDRLVVVGLSTGKLLALDKVLGAPRWDVRLATPDGRSELERLVDIDGSAIVHRDVIYASSYNGSLVAVDNTGNVQWQEDGSSYNRPVFKRGRLFLTLEDGSIQSYDAYNGAMGWRQAGLTERLPGVVSANKQYLLVVDDYGYLYVLNQQDGRIQGRELLRPKPLHRSQPHQGEGTNWRALRGRNFGGDSPLLSTPAGVLVHTNAGELILVKVSAVKDA